jgi:hypothetical protein
MKCIQGHLGSIRGASGRSEVTSGCLGSPRPRPERRLQETSGLGPPYSPSTLHGKYILCHIRSSRARTVTYACAMEHMSDTLLKVGFFFFAPIRSTAPKTLDVVHNLLYEGYSAGSSCYMAARLPNICIRTITQHCMSACGCLLQNRLPLTETTCG